jgi:PAS domain S-box-containing protein
MYTQHLKYLLRLFLVLATLSWGSALAQPASNHSRAVVQTAQNTPPIPKLDITLFGRRLYLTFEVGTLGLIVILALLLLLLTAVLFAYIARRRTKQARAANQKLQEEIAQRKRAEEQTRQLNDTLEQRVAGRTAELESANVELECEIAERINAEQALSAALEKERLLLDSALDVICTVDADGRFVSVNPACQQVFGYSQEELIGRRYIELVVPEDVPKTNEVAAKILAGEKATDFENRYQHKDGSQVPVMWSASWSENQQLMFAVARDITQRHLVEEKLKTFAAELQRSNSELQDFASVASHDLQEPLRKIQSFAGELRVSMGSKSQVHEQDLLDRMIAATVRMRTLINDLLDFSRITTMAKPFVPVDLGLTVKEVWSDLEARTSETKARIEVCDLPTIDADPMQMRQLLQNLIGNGLKFHAPDVAPIIKISGENGGPNYKLSVADNGIGFDEKYLDRIFAVFQRLHGRMEYEGTGIGLAICRKIAERHGGQIGAHSAPGAGSIFTVTLPLKQSNEKKP